MYTLVFKSLN